MKKKKKQPKRKQKIDVVLESLLNLERQVKELIKKVDTLKYPQANYPTYQPPKDANKYWPNHSYKTKWNPPEYN